MARKSLKENKETGHQCAWNEHGEICDRYGHLSQSTNGSGSWYCGTHFGKLMGWPKPATGSAFTAIVREMAELVKGHAGTRLRARIATADEKA